MPAPTRDRHHEHAIVDHLACGASARSAGLVVRGAASVEYARLRKSSVLEQIVTRRCGVCVADAERVA